LFIITHSIDFQTQVQPTGLGDIILPIRIDNQMPVSTIIDNFVSLFILVILDTKYIEYQYSTIVMY